MPVRVHELLTDDGMAFEPPVLPATVEKGVLLPELGLTLRRLNLDQTKFDAGGRYYETVAALPNWAAEGLTELFGFESIEYLDPDLPSLPEANRAKIFYRLSNDGGTTWRVWKDGPDAWVPAAPAEFNDLPTVDKRIPLLPFGNPRQVRVQCRLVPGSNGRQRPVLRHVAIFNKHRMDLYEDVTRSIKRHIDANISVPMFYYAEVVTPTTTITIGREPGLDVTVSEPIKVYNISTDPGRNIDLFVSLGGPDNRTVTILGPQTGQVEVQFTGVPEVFVGAEEFFQISKIPSVVVFVPKTEQYLEIRVRLPETERSISRMVGRLQFPRLYYRINVTVRVQSALKREALQMTDAIARILDQGDCFTSVANGECYCVYRQDNEVAEDRVAQGLFVGAVNLEVLGKVWLKDEVLDESNLPFVSGTIPLVATVVSSIGGEVTCNLNLPPHLRRVYREETRTTG